MVNYSESSIYKLCCKDVNVKEIYVGSTVNFTRRKCAHKGCCNNKNSKENLYVYQFIRANGGFINFDMIEIERYKASDKKDLEKRERYWIELLSASLNSIIPTRSSKEWYQENKEVVIEKQRNYKEKNKEVIIEKQRNYNKKNKEVINEKSKIRYEKNKEVIIEKRKEKITCECGSILRKCNSSKHNKTKKHKVWESIYNFIYS
jgi:hypothetical protein